MDPIKIEVPYDKANFIRLNKIRWKVQMLRNLKKLRNLSFWAVPLLVIGILFVSPEDPFNPFLFIGIVLTLTVLFYLVWILLSRSSYLRKIQDLAIKLDEAKMDCSYEFSNDLIKYQDKEKYLEIKWTAFSNYSLYKSFLFILVNDSYSAAYIFENVTSEKNDFERILELTKEKLPFKK
jgi:hypothetical protein